MSDRAARHRKVRGQDFDTNELARAAMPYLSRIRADNAGVYSILLGTGDGLHICSLGLATPEDAAAMAALNSSMLGVADSQVRLLDPDADANSTADAVVSVTLPDGVLVLSSIVYPPLDHLVLAVSAQDTQLGVVIHEAREASRQLASWLDES